MARNQALGQATGVGVIVLNDGGAEAGVPARFEAARRNRFFRRCPVR